MMMGYGMGFGNIWMIIFWIVIIAIGIWALASLFPRAGDSTSTKSENDALTILKQRYARGELSKEEYQSIRHDLEN